MAIKHLKYSVRKRRNEDEFHFLMALSYLKKGDKKSALDWLVQAEESTDTDARKKKYSELIEILQSGSGRDSMTPISSAVTDGVG